MDRTMVTVCPIALGAFKRARAAYMEASMRPAVTVAELDELDKEVDRAAIELADSVEELG